MWQENANIEDMWGFIQKSDLKDKGFFVVFDLKNYLKPKIFILILIIDLNFYIGEMVLHFIVKSLMILTYQQEIELLNNLEVIMKML